MERTQEAQSQIVEERNFELKNTGGEKGGGETRQFRLVCKTPTAWINRRKQKQSHRRGTRELIKILSRSGSKRMGVGSQQNQRRSMGRIGAAF